MTPTSWRARGCMAAALLSILTPGILQADPYYTAWTQLYEDTDQSLSQVPVAIAVDARGNVFVTGWQTVGSGKGMYTAKYDGLDGHRIWFREVNPAGFNEFIPASIAVDSQGNCAVTASRNIFLGGIDYYTVKYNGADGSNGWAAGAVTLNGAHSGADYPTKVIFDHADNVIVTGRSVGDNAGNSTGFDWVTVKYAQSNGAELARDSYSQTTTNLDDIPAGLAVDSSNNIYVAGTVETGVNNQHFYLRKLNATGLTKLWDIVPINTGGNADSEFGATAVAVDSADSVVVTGCGRDGVANHFGYYTAKYTSTGTLLWSAAGPYSADTFGNIYSGDPIGGFRPRPIGIAIGPDNGPIVTGTLLDSGGNPFIQTVKYTSGGFLGGAFQFWPTPSIDTGAGFNNTVARAIATDGASNAIVVGETQNADGNTDLYVAKYDALTGERVSAFTLSGKGNASSDKGVDVAVDRLGNISALGNLGSSKDGSPGVGISEFGILRLDRFITPTADDLPDGIAGVDDEAKVLMAGTPAISDKGLATKITFKNGTKVKHAILLESSPAGGTLLPAVQGEDAPVAVGDPAATWASFSDPVLAANGHYAFAAKVSGTASKANGVWADFGSGLKLVFRQGSTIPVTGSMDKFASLTNMGLSSNSMMALVKLAGPAATNTALIRVDNALNGAVMLRTGQSGLMINGVDYTVKKISIFSPAKSEAGDGRWQGAAGVVCKVSAVKTSDLKTPATAIVSIANGGGPIVYFYTGQTAASPISSATYSDFGLPSTATGTQRFAVKATLTPRPAASNSALIYSPSAGTFVAFAQKGVSTGVAGLDANITYADFTDPIVNTNSLVAYIATLKGTSALVKPTSNKAIVYGGPQGILIAIARTGNFATDSAGDATNLKWTAFTALANPGGAGAGPIFVGKLGTSKNNLGLWAYDASIGKPRLLLRQGDKLDTLTVRKFVVLNTLPKVMSDARSFDSLHSVAVFITFTNGKTAIKRIGIP